MVEGATVVPAMDCVQIFPKIRHLGLRINTDQDGITLPRIPVIGIIGLIFLTLRNTRQINVIESTYAVGRINLT